MSDCTKKIVIVLAAAIVLLPVLFVSSCKKIDSGSLAVSLDSTVVLGYTGGTFKVPVACDGSWTAVCDSSRVMVAPAFCKGNCKLSITVPPSENKFDKQITVKVSPVDNPSFVREISILQSAAPYIYFDSEDIDAPYAGGAIVVTLYANAAWKLYSGATYKGWLSATEGTGTTNLTITVPAATRTKTTKFVFALTDHDYPNIKANLNIKQTKPQT